MTYVNPSELFKTNSNSIIIHYFENNVLIRKSGMRWASFDLAKKYLNSTGYTLDLTSLEYRKNKRATAKIFHLNGIPF